jgi:hypothetical protein
MANTNTAERSDRIQIAQTIIDQIGGHRALYMLGAVGQAWATDRGVEIHIKGSRTVNRITITLDPSDTYSVRFSRVAKIRNSYEYSDRTVYETDDIYADSLVGLIESKTGLYLRLF